MTNPTSCQNKCYFHFVLFFFFLLPYGICIACYSLCAFCLPSFHSIFSLYFILGYFHEISSKPVIFTSSKLMSLSRVIFTSVTVGFSVFPLDFILLITLIFLLTLFSATSIDALSIWTAVLNDYFNVFTEGDSVTHFISLDFGLPAWLVTFCWKLMWYTRLWELR